MAVMSRAATSFKLRDYQEHAVENVLSAIERGIKRPAVVLATGGGKTVVMAHLIPRIRATGARSRVLILAHKEEIVRQTAETVRRMNPGLDVEVDMLKQVPTSSADVIVGSVPTLTRLSRLTKHDPAQYKAIVVDECHHATATSWTKILTHFGALEPSSDIAVVGFTATMERADGKALGSVFEEIVYEKNLLTMIKSKELCDVRFSTIEVDLSLDDVRTKFGDYDTKQLSGVVNQENINLQVARAYVQLRKGLQLKSTMVFCVDIAHCQTLCGVLQTHGINAQYVTGDTVRHERRAILDDFKAGKIEVLCNVLVFTEGTDIPNIDSMILARPTKSRPLLTQMIGRGLRLHQEKSVCHVIDMVGTMRVGVLTVPTLFGLPGNHRINKKSFEELELEKEEQTQIEIEQAAKKRRDEISEIAQLQDRILHLKLQFTHFDGFAAYLSGEKQPEQKAAVLEAFRRSHLMWARLEYNVWGLESSTSGSYYTIERAEDPETGKLDFKLYSNEFALLSSIRASEYRRPRKTKSLMNTGNVEYLIPLVENIMGRKQFMAERLPTAKQVKYSVKLLTKKVSSLYPGRIKELEDKLTQCSMERVSLLIFATKYSVNSLWVKWELKQLLGVPPEMQIRLERDISRLTRQLPRLKYSDSTKENLLKSAAMGGQ